MQSTVRGTATRIAIQSALKRYYDGNDTAENWARPIEDLQAVFSGGGAGYLAIQSKIYPYNTSNRAVVNATATDLMDLQLPFNKPDGTPATLGDPQYGFIDALYPTFEPTQTPSNATAHQITATWKGRTISAGNYLLCGPYALNDTMSLISITMPIINNTSSIDTLGWITTVLDAHLITDIVTALEGLDNTGMSMLFAPNNETNKFPPGVLFNSRDARASGNQQVKFVLPPTLRTNQRDSHETYGYAQNATAFDWSKFPAIQRGYTEATGASNNAGSIISTDNEEGRNVAVGYALVNSSMVDWMYVVEQDHSEVWKPIYRLRNVIIACVFGTAGAMLILAFPVAHYSSRPIRRLRDATKRTVSPQPFDDSSFGSQQDGIDEAHDEALARKEGWFGKIIHFQRNRKASRAERREAERRRQFRIPTKVKDRKHFIHDELTDLTKTFNEMTDELMMQYEKLEERVAQRTAELEQSKKAAEAANESKTLFIAVSYAQEDPQPHAVIHVRSWQIIWTY